MNRTILPIMLSLMLTTIGGTQADAADQGDVRRSVVRVFATQRGPDLLRPWQKQAPR